ncbi:Protein sprint [Trichinella britovi]|uniref:Protein sprint n=1 Tax=Trichinella britovi TaxID=45882 RepID=A0A0V1CCR0_TRIBR|nr:Protein sprint [Trichinella britovi]
MSFWCGILAWNFGMLSNFDGSIQLAACALAVLFGLISVQRHFYLLQYDSCSVHTIIVCKSSMAAVVGKVPVSASSSVSSLSSLESATGEDDDVFAAAVESGSATGHSGRSGHSVQNSEPSPQRRAAVSSMERLVRTHPIWNLPHVDRLAASHLLRNSDIGNFIVRRSTQPNSMALTVKLSSADDQEAIEHYLIEVTSVGVRLEGSPNTFAALPLLLAYYMDNGEELECKLTLPRTVMQCETRRELCSYALLGQEFWTADLIPSDGRKIVSGKVRKAALLPAVVQSENSNNRSMSLSSCPSKAGCSTQTLASSKNTATKTMAGAKVALTTMTTAITTTTTTTTATTTTTTLAATPVFSTNSSCGGTAARVGAGCKLVPASKARSGSLSDAFGSRLLLNSNAADSCGRKPFKFRSFFEHTRQPVIGRESRSTSASRGTACRTTPERRLAGLFQPDEPVCTGTPTLARKKLLTFKPANPSSSIANSTTNNSNNSSTGFRNFGSSLRTCTSNSSGFGMLRREKSDLGWTNNITHEPWRQTSAQSGQSSLSKLNGCPNFLSNCTISSGGSTTSRLRSCVEELKRCRIGGALASRRLLTRSTLPKPAVSSPATSLNISSARAANSSNSLLRLSASKKATPRANEQSSELRHVSKRNRDGQGKRLSAPGLIDAGGGMVELLRELKTRQGQLLLNGGSESVSRPTATTTRNVATNVATATATTTTTTNVIPLVTAVATVTTAAAAATTTTTTTTVANANNGNTPPLRVVAMNKSNSNLTTIKEIAASIRERHRSRSLEAILAEEEEEAGRVVDSAAPTPRRRQKEVARRRAVVEPAPKRESDYGVLRESTVSGVSGEELDDSRSVASMAGTVFSEPWDSSMWENLLTIATSMDQPEENANKTQMEPAVWRMANSSPTAPSSPAVYTKVNPCNSPASQNAALADHIRAFQNNNFPTMFAPPWDEFSRRIPLPSEGGASIARSSVSGGSADSPSSSRDSSSRRLELIARERFVDQLNSFSVSDCDSDSLMAKAKTQKRRSHRIDSGIKIQNCVVQYVELARNSDTFIGAQVQSFIKCTMEAQETDPHVVLGNVRQFINGLKNYLVKQGEAAFHSLIEMERSNLKPNEFLNIDAILEGVLQKIILAPLKSHIYHILVKESSKNGSLETFSENMAALRAKLPEELGILEDKCDGTKMDKVRSRLRSMQHHYSPLKKLEYLLSAVSVVYKGSGSVYETTNSSNATLELPAADELVRLLVYLLSRCSVVGCEIEADYIWGLLHPALLFGEASYYLTALSSAVHVLKHIDLLPKLHDNCPFAIESIETAGAFLRVAIPDEVSGAIHNHCFPALPQISAAKLCRMIAHKFGITNPEDHGIYLLVDGFETCLLPSECPEMVKEQLRAAGKPHMFAYKRHEAKIAWPKVAVSPASQWI